MLWVWESYSVLSGVGWRKRCVDGTYMFSPSFARCEQGVLEWNWRWKSGERARVSEGLWMWEPL